MTDRKAKSRTTSIADGHTKARVAAVCPTCSGNIWPGRTIGLVDGEWLCDRCFLFDDIPPGPYDVIQEEN